jgi:hypothetical protein
MDLFTAPETLPFGIALGVLVGVAIIEGLGVFIAASPSSWLDNLLADSDLDADGMIDGTLGWLHVGRVPFLVLLILFLLGFSLSGYLMQMFARGILGSFAPAWLVSVPAFLVGVTTVRGLGALLAHIIPKDETSAVSEQSLIGRAGIVMTGTARQGLAAQVRVRDVHGHSHYLMVEPDVPGEEFPEGSSILIVRKDGALYRGIRNPHPELL